VLKFRNFRPPALDLMFSRFRHQVLATLHVHDFSHSYGPISCMSVHESAYSSHDEHSLEPQFERLELNSSFRSLQRGSNAYGGVIHRNAECSARCSYRSAALSNRSCSARERPHRPAALPQRDRQPCRRANRWSHRVDGGLALPVHASRLARARARDLEPRCEVSVGAPHERVDSC